MIQQKHYLLLLHPPRPLFLMPSLRPHLIVDEEYQWVIPFSVQVHGVDVPYSHQYQHYATTINQQTTCQPTNLQIIYQKPKKPQNYFPKPKNPNQQAQQHYPTTNQRKHQNTTNCPTLHTHQNHQRRQTTPTIIPNFIKSF